MRLICPNCTAQYDVAESAIPENGRDVQCANCSHIWYQEPVLVLEPSIEVTPTLAPAFQEQETPKSEIDGIFRSAREGQTPPNTQTMREYTPEPDAHSAPQQDRLVDAPADPPVSLRKEPSPTPTPAPETVQDDLQSSVLDVLRQEAAYSSNDQSDAPAENKFSLEIPELADETVSEQHIETPQIADPDPTPVQETVPSAKTEAPYDSSSVSSVKDEISEMFEKIESTQTPADPMLASSVSEDSFNTPQQVPEISEPTAPVIEQPPVSVDQDFSNAQPETGQETDNTSEKSSMAATVASGAVAVGAAAAVGAKSASSRTVDVASFIERLKQTEETDPQSPAEQAYNSSSGIDLNETPLVNGNQTSGLGEVESAADALTQKAQDIGADIAQPINDIQETPTAQAEVSAPAVSLRKGKEIFTDVAELESALEIEADKAQADKADVDNLVKELNNKKTAKNRDRWFINGFYAACLTCALGTVLYMFNDDVKRLIPGASGTLDTYTSQVDKNRMVVQKLYTEGGEPGLANFGNNALGAILNR